MAHLCNCEAAPAPAGPEHAKTCPRHPAFKETVVEPVITISIRIAMEAAMEIARREEREACARICDDDADTDTDGRIGRKIRARGTA